MVICKLTRHHDEALLHFSIIVQVCCFKAEPVFYNEHGKPITREEAGYTEEEEEEDSYGEYVLTEEEEREFQQFQEEVSIGVDVS